MLKQLGRFASLNNDIDIAADSTAVDVDHVAHAGGAKMCRLAPKNLGGF